MSATYRLTPSRQHRVKRLTNEPLTKDHLIKPQRIHRSMSVAENAGFFQFCKNRFPVVCKHVNIYTAVHFFLNKKGQAQSVSLTFKKKIYKTRKHMGTQEDIKNKQFACFSRSHFQVKSRRVAGWGNPVGGWEGDGRQGGMDRFLHRPTERTGGLTKN